MPDVPTTTTIIPSKNDDSSLPTETCVVCLKGAGFGRSHVLKREALIFGRDPECSYPLDDPAVSRQHCRIEPDGDGFRLVDLDSRNGTFLNRARLHGSASLKDGDLIKVGEHVFKFLRRNAVELAYHERMAQLSMVDELTGAMNRRAIMDALHRDMTIATREQSAVAVIAVDIDRFKHINDTRGHSVGDLVLIEVVKRLKASVRPTDKVGRVGGEEFLVVLPDTQRDVAVALAERLRVAVSSAPVLVDGEPLPVTISLGVCERLQWIQDTGGFPELPRCIEAMLVTADARLYDAKNAGRNRVAY
ncbi:MAG: GGDEF domain-containing protein [Myxococcales bacterium]|nr:GGDEF domain-containing protein [Myxococcales bacterium]